MVRPSTFFFSNEDFEFIKAVFMKENTLKFHLEEDFHFRLILHKRDFTPGVTIQANIVDAITKSRRMFMVLSRYVEMMSNGLVWSLGSILQHTLRIQVRQENVYSILEVSRYHLGAWKNFSLRMQK